jgi:hypothetical protein
MFFAEARRRRGARSAFYLCSCVFIRGELLNQHAEFFQAHFDRLARSLHNLHLYQKKYRAKFGKCQQRAGRFSAAKR